MNLELSIIWEKETKLNINEFKELFKFEKKEIKLLKSWMWNNQRIIDGLKSFREINETLKNKILPAVENIHSELLCNKEISNKEFTDNFKTKDFPIGTSGDLSSVVYTNHV